MQTPGKKKTAQKMVDKFSRKELKIELFSSRGGRFFLAAKSSPRGGGLDL
jgi:hypothetical protein